MLVAMNPILLAVIVALLVSAFILLVFGTVLSARGRKADEEYVVRSASEALDNKKLGPDYGEDIDGPEEPAEEESSEEEPEEVRQED